MEREQIWWEQPGPANVVDRVVKAVASRRRALCLAAPDPRPFGLYAAIERKLRADLSLECATLDVAGEDQSQSIPHLLAGFLNVPAVEIGSISDFASHPGLVDQVVVVDGIDRRHLRRWSLFLRQLISGPAGDLAHCELGSSLTHKEITQMESVRRLISERRKGGSTEACGHGLILGRPFDQVEIC